MTFLYGVPIRYGAGPGRAPRGMPRIEPGSRTASRRAPRIADRWRHHPDDPRPRRLCQPSPFRGWRRTAPSGTAFYNTGTPEGRLELVQASRRVEGRQGVQYLTSRDFNDRRRRGPTCLRTRPGTTRPLHPTAAEFRRAEGTARDRSIYVLQLAPFWLLRVKSGTAQSGFEQESLVARTTLIAQKLNRSAAGAPPGLMTLPLPHWRWREQCRWSRLSSSSNGDLQLAPGRREA